jgi:hypothetical protein
MRRSASFRIAAVQSTGMIGAGVMRYGAVLKAILADSGDINP